MSEKLKPCPFCGSEDVTTTRSVLSWIALCRECDARAVWFCDEEEAIDKWNRRAEPKPKAVDRYGNEVHEGDWISYGGRNYKVGGILPDSFAEIASGNFVNTSHCTLCPLGADGKPILVGETVYDSSGAAMQIVKIDQNSVSTRQAKDLWSDWYDPSLLTHEAPDSWERLEEDANLTDSAYIDKRRPGKDRWSFTPVKADIVARAKKLAGAE